MPGTMGSTNPAPRLSKVAENQGSVKQVEQAFGAYMVARNQFVNQLAGFLDKKDSQNVTLEALMKNDVMAVLCCPLAQDPVAGIQSLSLQCLGKLAAADPLLSQVVVSCGVLDSIIVSLSHESAPVQASANQVLTSVASSTTDFAARILKAGAVPNLVRQLQSGPPAVKEAAVRTLNALCLSSPDHAALICDDTVLSLLVSLLLVKDSPHSLLKALVLCLSSLAAGGTKLSEALVKHKALEPLTNMVRGANTPPDLKAASLNAMAQLARHHEELANQVANQGVLHSAVQLLTDKMNPAIRRNAAAVLLQAVQKTPDLAEVVSKAGAPSSLQKYMKLEEGNREGILAGNMLIGSISSYRAALARSMVDAGTGAPVIACVASKDPEIAGVAAWAVEQMAQHGEECAGPLLAAGALQQLIDAFVAAGPAATAGRHSSSSGVVSFPTPQAADRAAKIKRAIKTIVRCAATSQSLEPFVDEKTPQNILGHVLRKLEVLLAKSPKGRQSFVTSGALQRLVALKAGLSQKPQEPAEAILSLFPEDVVKYYSNGLQC